MLYGFYSWLTIELPGTRVRSPVAGSFMGTNILLMAAFSDHFYSIGWYQACLGHISIKWSELLKLYWPKVNLVQWSLKVI
jgi:hypothetical protein